MQAARVSVSFGGHTAHCGTESELQLSLRWQSYFHFFTRILVLFGTTFRYSRKRRQGEEGKQSGKADILTVGAHFLSHNALLPTEKT